MDPLSGCARTEGTLVAAYPGNAVRFLDALRSLAAVPARLVVLEPHHGSAVQLERLLANVPDVSVVPALLGAAPDRVEMIAYNVPGLRSTVPPTAAMRMLYPGFRARGRYRAGSIDPAELAGNSRGMVQPLHLWIDAPGQELAILAAWEKAGLLTQTRQLYLRCSAVPLFAGGAGLQHLQAWAEARDFRQTNLCTDDPDWPSMTLTADPSARLQRELQAELEGVRKALSEANERADRQKARIGELEHRLELSSQELHRAEGQIRLIRDLLLGEARL
ncbi:MAG: hypothetical protein ACK4LQ_13455 [Pararhodobacter sp.]